MRLNYIEISYKIFFFGTKCARAYMSGLESWGYWHNEMLNYERKPTDPSTTIAPKTIAPDEWLA